MKEYTSASATACARVPSLMEFLEVKGDLFSCPSSSSLAHCVSEDMAMGKGVAVLFKKEFGGVGDLKAQGVIESMIQVALFPGPFQLYNVVGGALGQGNDIGVHNAFMHFVLSFA